MIPLPTAVDIDMFHPISRDAARQEEGLCDSAPIYTFIGRLAAIKGIPLILNAFRIVLRQEPKALLLIVGDGEERESLTHLAVELDISSHVRFYGMVPPQRVRTLIGCADACLVASYHEGFSVAMVEQIACGRPIVSTDVSGARELIQDGVTGFVLKDRDENAYAQNMLDVLNLKNASSLLRQLAVQEYSEQTLWNNAGQHWKPLANALSLARGL